MATDPKDPKPPPNAPDRKGDVAVEERQETEKARRWAVIFHNDDYTTREFVVEALMKYFHKTETEAMHIMLTVHHKGQGIAGVYPRDLAETKVDQVHRHAESSGFPLRLSAEPIDD